MHARVINELELPTQHEYAYAPSVDANVRLSRGFVEGALRILQATCKERTAKHKQEVRQNGSEHLSRH